MFKICDELNIHSNEIISTQKVEMFVIRQRADEEDLKN